MDKTLYEVDRFGNLSMVLAGDRAIFDGVVPYDMEDCATLNRMSNVEIEVKRKQTAQYRKF